MRLKDYISILLLTCVANSHAQIKASEQIDESNLMSWIPKFTLEYQGQYHFGNSEWESSLRIIMTGGDIVAQIVSGKWSKDGMSYKVNYDNLTKLEIDKAGNFKSERYNGKFVTYKEGNVILKCLKIFNSWSIDVPKGQYEIGCITSNSLEAIYSGRYGYASYQELDPSELTKYTSEELRIMRNEIFARYGYIFKNGGEMKEYFSQQKWYNPQHEDVTKYLTNIENHNIQLILAAEKRH